MQTDFQYSIITQILVAKEPTLQYAIKSYSHCTSAKSDTRLIEKVARWPPVPNVTYVKTSVQKIFGYSMPL